MVYKRIEIQSAARKLSDCFWSPGTRFSNKFGHLRDTSTGRVSKMPKGQFSGANIHLQTSGLIFNFALKRFCTE